MEERFSYFFEKSAPKTDPVFIISHFWPNEAPGARVRACAGVRARVRACARARFLFARFPNNNARARARARHTRARARPHARTRARLEPYLKGGLKRGSGGGGRGSLLGALLTQLRPQVRLNLSYFRIRVIITFLQKCSKVTKRGNGTQGPQFEVTHFGSFLGSFLTHTIRQKSPNPRCSSAFNLNMAYLWSPLFVPTFWTPFWTTFFGHTYPQLHLIN